MSLSTGQVLNRLHATALPMPDNVVGQVHRMAWQQKTNPWLLFGDCNMNSLNDQDIGESRDDEDDEEYVPDDEDSDEGQNCGDEDVSYEYDHDETGSIEEEYDEPTDNDAINVADEGMNTHEEVNLGRLDGGAGLVEPENPGVDDAANDENTEVNGIENLGVDQINNEIINHKVEDVEHPEEKEDSESTEGETVGIDQECGETENEMGCNLRQNCKRSYKHLYNPEVFDTGKSNDVKQAEVLMTTINDAPEEAAQMSTKNGLKIFSEEGYAAMKKEMQQLHDRKVMQPIN